jgi:hypothetical protein
VHAITDAAPPGALTGFRVLEPGTLIAGLRHDEVNGGVLGLSARRRAELAEVGVI